MKTNTSSGEKHTTEKFSVKKELFSFKPQSLFIRIYAVDIDVD